MTAKSQEVNMRNSGGSMSNSATGEKAVRVYFSKGKQSGDPVLPVVVDPKSKQQTGNINTPVSALRGGAYTTQTVRDAGGGNREDAKPKAPLETEAQFTPERHPAQRGFLDITVMPWGANYLLYVNKFLDKVPFRRDPIKMDKLLLLAAAVLIYFWAAGQPLLGLSVLLFVIFYYVFMGTPASRIIFQIETDGVRIGDDLFMWENLRDFWVSTQGGYYVLYIRTTVRFPPLIAVVTNKEADIRELILILGHFLPYRSKKDLTLWETITMGKYVPVSEFIEVLEIFKKQKELEDEIMNIMLRSIQRAARIYREK